MEDDGKNEGESHEDERDVFDENGGMLDIVLL